ncbi:MAG: hypothetical protein ABIC95_04590 [archaeon]
MMDIEKTMKVNKLIAELKKHKVLGGIDAVARAHEIVHDGEKPEEQPQVPKGQPVPDSAPEAMMIALAETTTMVRAELDLLKRAILSVDEEVGELRQKVAALESRPVQTAPPPAPVKEEQATLEKPAAEEPKKEASGNDHPRSGGFSEDDVSIEKIFYAGKK